MKKYFPYLILLSALSVSVSAAFYSVFGLSKLFAGASIQVIIMGTTLEIAKLIIVTLLHQYWKDLKSWLKIYFISAEIILVIITSAGIYGFLSAAYQETSDKDKILTRGIELIDSKKNIFNEKKKELLIEKNSINNSISELRLSMSNSSQIQYIDKKTGQKINTTNTSIRKSLEKQLDEAVRSRDKLSDQLTILIDSIGKFEIEKIQLINTSESTSELGPLRYLSKITKSDMDIVVNWFLILIMLVFDPLAIALVLAANFTFGYNIIKKERSLDTLNVNEDTQRFEPIITTEDEIKIISDDVNKMLDNTKKQIKAKETEYKLKDITEKKK